MNEEQEKENTTEHKEENKESHDSEEKPLDRLTKKELIQKINELKKQVETNYDLYLRAQAEIENIKKRNQKAKEEWVKYANENLIKELLPVIDNLEKALSHSNNENAIDALREGVELTLKGLKNTLCKAGLEEIECIGKPFDPNYHEAVSEQEDENKEPGTVLQELQKGYILNQRLIRPSMVVVCKGKTESCE